jgi:hypothetical protein
MKSSFNVVCDSSNNRYSQITNSTTSFNFDWSLVKDCNYNVTFSYMSADTTTTLTQVMCVSTDFGSSNTYLANGTGASSKINLLGSLIASKHGANSYYFAEAQTNPAVQLQRPSNNIFTIFLKYGTTNIAYNDPVASAYVLILHFEECEE